MKRILQRLTLAGVIIAAITVTSVTLAPQSFAHNPAHDHHYNGFGQGYYGGYGQGYGGGYGRSYYGGYQQNYVTGYGTGTYGYSGYGSGLYGYGLSDGYVYPSVEGYGLRNGGYPYRRQYYGRAYSPYGSLIYSPFGYGAY